MRILVMSDPHGSVQAYKQYKKNCIENNANVGIISGDLTTYSESPFEDEQKLKSILDSIEIPILFIMGNDDEFEWENGKKTININQRKIVINNHCFIGYQYTNPFIGGDFEKDENNQLKDFEELEKLCEDNYILVTHGPAFGILDKVGNNKNVGSKALLGFINKTKPLYHVFGHIHEDSGILNNSINASFPISKSMYLIITETNEIKELREKI